MNEQEDEHFLTLEDFKAKYADMREAKETALFNKVVLGAQSSPGTTKPLPDGLLNLLQKLTTAIISSATLMDLEHSRINDVNARLTKLEERRG